MNVILDLSQIREADPPQVGGKAFGLTPMAAEGLPVPSALCVGTEAYRLFLDAAGLRGSILTEYHRKDFERMRWEEMWDAALRIQSIFRRADPLLCVAEIRHTTRPARRRIERIFARPRRTRTCHRGRRRYTASTENLTQ
jgi:phosphoenolpyruvate synthase/pyruvate phosphate dikinase